jgi:hypothetical protein
MGNFQAITLIGWASAAPGIDKRQTEFGMYPLRGPDVVGSGHVSVIIARSRT